MEIGTPFGTIDFGGIECGHGVTLGGGSSGPCEIECFNDDDFSEWDDEDGILSQDTTKKVRGESSAQLKSESGSQVSSTPLVQKSEQALPNFVENGEEFEVSLSLDAFPDSVNSWISFVWGDNNSDYRIRLANNVDNTTFVDVRAYESSEDYEISDYNNGFLNFRTRFNPENKGRIEVDVVDEGEVLTTLEGGMYEGAQDMSVSRISLFLYSDAGPDGSEVVAHADEIRKLTGC